MPAHDRTTAVLCFALATALALAGCDSASPTPASEGAGSSAAPAPAGSDDLDTVTALVRERMDTYADLTVGAVALVRVGDRSEVLTTGLARRDPDRPWRARMTFPVASITKPMVATAVLQLVEEGRVDLDDRVQRWVPELDAAGAPITVRQLLSHRGGLHELVERDVERVGLDDTAALVAASARHGLDVEPDTRGVYSNEGFAALGLLLERELGQPLDEVLAERVFEPAGMSTAALAGTPDVHGYSDGDPVTDYFLEFLPAAGSVVASADDVDAFFRTLWAGGLVPDDLVSAMREPQGQVRIGQFWNTDYGLGLIRWRVSCGMAIGHSGRLDGFTTEAWTLEDGSRATVVALNEVGVDEVGRSIVDAALCAGDGA